MAERVRHAAVIGLILTLGVGLAPAAEPDAAFPGEVQVEPPTLHCLGVRWPVLGDRNGNCRVEVRYRRTGDETWQEGLPLLRTLAAASAEQRELWAFHPGNLPPERVPGGRLFAGSLLNLAADTAYEVQLDLRDPDGGDTSRTLTLRTRAEPVAPAGMRVRQVVPGDGGGKGTLAAPFLGLADAVNAAMPGDTLLLHAGVYALHQTLPFPRDGTAAQPIVVRGAGDGEAIIDGGGDDTTDGRLLDACGREHIWLEDLALRGRRYLLVAHESSHLVVRRCRFSRMLQAIVAHNGGYAVSQGHVISDNQFIGPTTWPRTQGIESFAGVCLSGAGHVVCYNRFEHLGDGVHGTGHGNLSASDYHNNDLFVCTDDGIEADYAETNVRVYLNRIVNVAHGVSAQPAQGGPVYIFRNVVGNATYSPFKLHNHTAGVYVVHNTCLRHGPGWPIQPARETVTDVWSRNNLFLATSGAGLPTTGRMIRCDFGGDGYGGFTGPLATWNGRTYATVQAAAAGGAVYGAFPARVVDLATCFANGLWPPTDPDRAYDLAQIDVRLSETSDAADRGVVVPGLSDGWRGSAPDLGAIERGDAVPHYGPRSAGAVADLPANRWVRLAELTAGMPGAFLRQEHGGSCFDRRRGRLLLFGSNTHGHDWLNSPRGFDPVTATWDQPYPDDPFETYAVNPAGLPVAGPHGDHPWTMHTFGSVVYDPGRDEMVVACADEHLVPGRFTDVMQALWPKVQVHPTWVWQGALRRWQPLACPPVHFFATAAAWDSARGVVLGYRADGIWELAGEPRTWRRRTTSVRLGGWHNNVAYDDENAALIAFGTNTNSNAVEAWWPASGEHRLQPTPGQRPPVGQHAPLEYVPEVSRTLLVVDRNPSPAADPRGEATVWLYDLAADRWAPLPEATLPFGLGMNYNLECDPVHCCLLLVTGPEPTVWALRVELPVGPE